MQGNPEVEQNYLQDLVAQLPSVSMVTTTSLMSCSISRARDQPDNCCCDQSQESTGNNLHFRCNIVFCKVPFFELLKQFLPYHSRELKTQEYFDKTLQNFTLERYFKTQSMQRGLLNQQHLLIQLVYRENVKDKIVYCEEDTEKQKTLTSSYINTDEKMQAQKIYQWQRMQNVHLCIIINYLLS